jgi:AcrR family transcriptional regulator
VGRNKTYDRSNILAIAMHTFWKFGYGATTLAELVSATGVDKKTLFREFNSKEGLFSDVLRLYVGSMSQHVDNKLLPQPLGLDNVRRYLDSMTFWASSPICLLTKTLSEFDLVTNEHRKIVRDALAYMEHRFTQNVKAAIERKELPSETPSGKAVKYLMYSVWGIGTMGYFEGSKPVLRSVSEAVMGGLQKIYE